MSDRMPRYDVRNDGVGPYAVFYCERDGNQYRSAPDVGGAIAQDIGRKALGGFLRNVPIVGGAVADGVAGQDPRYVYSLSPQQLQAAWNQVKDKFHECPTCKRLICPSDWDGQSGFCADDSSRKDDIARAQAEQAGAMLKGFANVFGVGDAIQKAQEHAQQAQGMMARCPTDGKLFPPGTKFCPDHGIALIQPTPAAPKMAKCPVDGELFPAGTKFCPNHGKELIQPS
jgi:hypothetical protein